MKNLYLVCLLVAFATTLVAQELPSVILEQYPELASFEREINGGDNSPVLEEYLLSARRTSSWDTYDLAWSISDSIAYSYNVVGDYEEVIGYDLEDNEWIPNFRTSYFYNDAQQITLRTIQSWVDGQWETVQGNTQDVYVYDDLGNRLEVSNQNWIDGEWQTYYKTTNTYYEGTNLKETELFQGDNNYNELVNFSLYIYEEYNSNGDILRYSLQSWDEFGMEWGSKTFYERTYNEDNQLILSVTSWEVNGEESPQTQSIYTYNDEGRTLEILRQDWDNSTGSWVNDRRTRYEYDENGYISLLEQAIYDPYTQEFDPFYLIIATNFDHGGIEQYVLQFNPGEGLVNDLRVSYTYYEGFFLEKTLLAEYWNPELNEWENNTFEEYFYNLFVDTDEQPLADDQAIVLFPNPAKNRVNLQINNPVFANTQLQTQLYNQQGQVVRQYNLGQSSNSINIEGLPMGSYWLKVSNGQQFIVEKLIVK
jgi:hypothetical protein